jgi:adenine-specific DNA-methyltransferase
MTEADTKKIIQAALQDFKDGDLSQKAIKFYQVLGYNTNRQNLFSEKTYRFFRDSFLNGNIHFSEEKALISEWKYVDLLFQLTQNEITPQHGLFDTKQVDRTIIETYLFFVIELFQDHYSRTSLSQITREVNKIFPMPVMVLFKYGQSLTLGVINRRLHKRDESKDVLEKVTLIKDICIENTHRAHIEILFDLSFPELLRIYKFTNFVELHNSWQKTLDSKELNKRFYKELSNWYFWAVNNVYFPNDVTDDKDDMVFNSESVIRMLTRLIFIWFIKEKKLIPENIFNLNELSRILKNINQPNSTNYYRAILQNLFFATLNQKREARAFVDEGSFEQNKKNYGVKNLFRYALDFKITKDEVIRLFDHVPFLNGGLFDCLDKEDDSGRVLYLDGFSRNTKKQAKVPDYLFFSEEKAIDLSEVYDDQKRKNERVKGLFEIFNHYKFTITENTPIEEEVALDPELLGRVFENLLASYNPETKTTARKQTGSFYTPREIVNYMVDQSLETYLKEKLVTTARMKPEDAESGLELLLGYNEKEHLFDPTQTATLIVAIDNCKILDPACGSGAFPMGILHKLVHILDKLDPGNGYWRQIQKDKAIDKTKEVFKIGNKQERQNRLEEINEIFENNSDDYGRKLFLIENCIYGVDIQPIAVQISKLRFFISLIVDQSVQKNKENFGIRPLPNLETKFVAANTLIGLEKPASTVKGKVGMGFLRNPEIEQKEEELKELRHKYFGTRTRSEKLAGQEKDRILRRQIGDLLISDGWNNKTAEQIVMFDPYDQNARSPFFNTEWMFGVMDGFDLVIGNPPYGARFTAEDKKYFKNTYKHQDYQPESYLFFTEKSLNLIKSNAVVSFIIPNTWLTNLKLKKIRRFLTGSNSILNISHYHKSIFDAVVDTEVVIIQKGYNELNNVKVYNHIDENQVQEIDHIQRKWKEKDGDVINIFTNEKIDKIVEKIKFNSKELSHFADVFAGVVPYEEGKGTPPQTRKMMNNKVYNSETKIDSTYRKVLRGSDINKYENNWDGTRWIKYGNNLAAPRKAIIFENPKIVIRQTGDSLIATHDSEKFISFKNTHVINKKTETNLKYLLALINSNLLNFYFQYLNPESGEALAEVKKENVEKLLIKNVKDEKPFIVLVDYILCIKKAKKNNYLFFELLINAMVYELYFPDEIKAAGGEVLKYLINLAELKDEINENQKQVTIQKIYEELSEPAHPVSIAIQMQKTVQEVRIIEGLD